MKLSQFCLYKNTYFTDMQNTLHFDSNEERDHFFDEEFGHDGDTYRFESNFNFRRDRGTIKIPDTFENLMGFNYCRFVNGFDGKTYYAYIVSMTYLNDATTQLDIVIDVVMTYTQGDFVKKLRNVEVIRQHLPAYWMNKRMDWLRNNNDTLATSSMMFTDPKMLGGGISFGACSYVIQSAVKLHDTDFGNEDAPKMKTATGERFDGISTPLNLYVVDGAVIKDVMRALSKYPWIAQNIKNVIKVPSLLIPKDLQGCSCEGIAMHILGNDKHSIQIDPPFHIALNDIRQYLGLKDYESYLVRDNVINLYITDYRGNQLNFETSKIGDDNHIKVSCVIGAFNEINIYSEQYGQRDTTKTKHGHYRDNEMVISQFDNVPVLINNYTLNKANTAYSRQLENSRQLSGRINTLTDNSASLQDRLFSAVSVYSNVFSGGLMSSPAKAVGLFSNEYEYYRDQKAQYKQWKIAPPTVTEGTFNNSILQNTNDYGLWLKVSRIDDDELNNLRRYYGRFGFEAMSGDNVLYDINSMPIANWVQFKGNYILPDIDRELLDQLKTIFEGGVRLFHHYRYMKVTPDFKDNYVYK